MSRSQRCANVMRRYGLKHPPDSIQRGCYEATCRELERQEQEILALRKDAVRYRAFCKKFIRPIYRPGYPRTELYIDGQTVAYAASGQDYTEAINAGIDNALVSQERTDAD